MYRTRTEVLEPSVSDKLEAITIVGMRYYPSSHEKIIAASHRKPEEQLLFLVPDVNNEHDKNAVALHDGRTKLGHVIKSFAPEVRRILARYAAETGQDHVLVVKVAPIKNAGDFTWSTSFNVKAIGVVYERIARKLARAIPETTTN